MLIGATDVAFGIVLKQISRREALGLLGAAGALSGVAMAGCGGDSATPTTPSSTTTTTGAAAASCVLTPQIEEGPFFVDERLNRSDVTTGTSSINVTSGVPLTLSISIVKYTATGCTVLQGAQVDMWEANAAGKYSDEASEGTSGDTSLRGYQISDGNGLVTFRTIWPGWYSGRAVHVHMMIRQFSPAGAQTSRWQTQLFFDPAQTASVLARAPYNARGTTPDTLNSADRLYSSTGGATLVATTGSATSGFAGAITLGVQGTT